MSLLKQLASSNYISVNKTLIKVFGLAEAVILGELCSEYDYWSDNDKLVDNSFYCSVQKLEENTGLSEYQQRSAIKNLETSGVISTKLKGIPATRYFEIDEDKLLNYLTSSSLKTKEQVPKKLNLSNNINNNNKNNKINNISKDIYTTPSKKLNLYQKCVNMIEEYTDDEVLRDYLKEFLKILIENNKENGTQLYSNTFKGKLNSLTRLSTDTNVQRDIVLQTLDNGWSGFYELKDKKNNKSAVSRIEHLDERDKDDSEIRQNKATFRRSIRDGNAEKF